MEETHGLTESRDLIASRGLGWLPDVPKPNDYSPSHAAVAPLLSKTKAAAM